MNPLMTSFQEVTESADIDLLSQANALGMDFVDLEHVQPDALLLRGFPTKLLFREQALPFARTDSGSVRVAVADPYNVEGISELAAVSGEMIETVVASARQIEAKLHEALGLTGGTVGELMQRNANSDGPLHDPHETSDESVNEVSVIRLVNELLVEALTQGASDIHIEPLANRLEIRFRVDGQLRMQSIPEELHCFRAAIVNRLKIMARLNIAERRLPQDGRAKLTVNGRDIDIRASVIPMLHGEGVVLRLLDQSRTAINLNQMPFAPAMLEQWRRIIRRPHGMVLVTGPTGSGKTTSLYASLAEIRNRSKKIITIEDPVEYHLDGVSQIQVNAKAGLTFATGLRSVLRHDPDVVLIGEIRDTETAISATQAALTGHLVFSTLHTNDAASAFTRLNDMGIEPFLTASTVHAVLAQRLVRRLCHACRERTTVRASLYAGPSFLAPEHPIYREVGCRSCHGTGFSGRLAIFELLVVDSQIRKLCSSNAGSMEIRAAALSQGMISLLASGWNLIALGETTIDEVLRVASDDESQAPVLQTATPTASEGSANAHV
jgi:type II secretory ATPase GspE/PulE/Tfp pilus assembly ATPase PilB-like protein